MKKQDGALIVEATFIMPLVVLTVFALIYLGLFKLQDVAILYQVQFVSRQVNNVVSSPGYIELGKPNSKSLDFNDEPSSGSITNYYKAYHKDWKRLYREIFGADSWMGSWSAEGGKKGYAYDVLREVYIFTGANLLYSNVKTKRNFLSYNIIIESGIEYPMPGLLKLFGMKGNVKVFSATETTAMNPADFIRDVDLAWDSVKALGKLLDIDVQGFASKAGNAINKFL